MKREQDLYGLTVVLEGKVTTQTVIKHVGKHVFTACAAAEPADLVHILSSRVTLYPEIRKGCVDSRYQGLLGGR